MAGIGSFEKRGKTSYRLTVSLGFDHNGKRIKKQKTIKAKNDTEAKIELAKFVTEIDGGEYIDPSKIKFADFVKEWREKYATEHLAPKTLESYEFPLKNFIIPVFGHLRLEQIKTIHVIDYLNSLKKDGVRKDGKPGGLSSSSIQYHHRILKDIFKRAVEWKLIKESPVGPGTRPKVVQEKTDVYTKEEVIQLFDLLQSEPIQWRIFFSLAITTGLRRGELLALRWSEIDFERGTLQVNHSLTHTKKYGLQLTAPKTESSRRTVSIPRYLLEEMKRYKHHKNQERIQADELWEGGEHFFLFSTWNGKPFYPSTPRTWWSRFIKRTNFKYIRLHDLRHTAATLLINEGEHAKNISARLGHADIKTTLNIYSHYLQEADERVADKLDALFSPDRKIDIKKA